uniref:Uncharacterized protein n=1 Tax=viral metagenome TaxID=1070528 RepID=A0A6M3LHM5_9ZZZZ
MGNMLVDAAQKQANEAVEKLQSVIGACSATTKSVYVKRAIASVDALKAALKAL